MFLRYPMNSNNSKEKRRSISNERGYTVVAVVFLSALALLLSVGMLDSSASNTKTRSLATTQAHYYYDVEETLNRVVGWLQQNSQSLVTAFTQANFNNNFDLGSPEMGDNEGEHFGVPTMVKMKGTDQSVMLSNNAFFGQAAFPATTNISSGASFDAVSAFQSADLGAANARVILVWARATSGNYEPVFRVDVVTGNNPDRGVHSFSYVYTTLSTSTSGEGFYGRDSLTTQTGNNECFSYQYTCTISGCNKGAQRENCPIASDHTVSIKSKIHGTAASLQNDGVVLQAPGGDVSGDVCNGSGCHSIILPSFPSWNASCPTSNSSSFDVDVTSGTHVLNSGGCYRDINIPNNKKVVFTDYNNPYYIRTLNFQANKAIFSIAAIPPGEKVTLYVDTLSNDHINGNQFYNPSYAPNQLRLNYTGSQELFLNGTADLNAIITAPNSDVTVNGNFNFYGAIKAQNLYVSGNARINYDEALAGSPVLSDMSFALRKTSQRYR